MTLVKVIINNETRANLIESVVKLEGGRTVDTAMFKITSKVEEQDLVKYIQDVTNLNDLTAIYNFQGNDRDEGGYDLDGDNNHTEFIEPNETKLSITNSSKFRGNYGIAFNQTNDTGYDKVIINNDSKFNFKGQFDINIYYHKSRSSPPATNETDILFSKHDNSNGIEIGIQYDGTSYIPYVKVFLNGVIHIINSSSTESAFGLNLIRVYRDDKNNIRLLLNHNFISEINLLGSLDCASDIWIGAGMLNNSIVNRFYGVIYQLRIYCGNYLTNDEAFNIYHAEAQPTTMKFIGRIWKIKDNTTYNECLAKSEGKIIQQINLTSDVLGSTIAGERANRTNTIFNENQDSLDIFQSLITRIEDDWIYYQNPTNGDTINGKYVIDGTLDDNAKLLMLLGGNIFTTLSRKIILVENDTGVTTNIKFTNGSGYVITDGGQDDSVVVNDLEVIGRSRLHHTFEQLGTISENENVILNEHPLNLRCVAHTGDYDTSGVVLIEGTTSDYTIDYDDKTIHFINQQTSKVSVEYDYENTNSSSTSMYIRKNDTISISNIGVYSNKLYVTQFTNKNDLNRLATRIINRGKDINSRHDVIIPFLFNGIRENHRVNVVNETKGINDDFIIKQIEYFYPDVKTRITVGEYYFDDLEGATSVSDTVGSLLNAQKVNKSN